MLKPLFQSAAVLVMLTVAVPLANAASDQKQMERKFEEGADALLEGMRLLLKTIPWYGQPQVKPNGDIIIPRRDAPALPPPPHQRPPAGEDKKSGDTQRL
ncbi:MAG: hypothetical protein O3B74_07330 [Proteobacteria bacterium]|nr:hypothetical protein [Pseudomonadota bacterium]MDA1310305.1 hypothetical protein [Pseudomonadota bacterium]